MHGFVGLGSNLGDRGAHLDAAVREIDRRGMPVRSVSSVWETEPVDAEGSPWFLNAVIRVETHDAPRAVLSILLEIERGAGRVREFLNAPRTLDLDLLWLDGVLVREPGLELPHPRMWIRRFVLAPLAEIEPDLEDPASGRRVRESLARLPDRPEARRVGALDWPKGKPVYSRAL